MQNASQKGSDDPSFEDALERLEDIVDSMEEGEISLDDLLSKYEEGNHLLKICNRRLRNAELKIELLKKTAEGDTTVPLEPDPS